MKIHSAWLGLGLAGPSPNPHPSLTLTLTGRLAWPGLTPWPSLVLVLRLLRGRGRASGRARRPARQHMGRQRVA